MRSVTSTVSGHPVDGTSKTAPLGLVIAAFAAVYVIWGSTYLGIRLAIDSIPPLLMAGARFMLAGCILYGSMRAFGAARPDGRHWGQRIRFRRIAPAWEEMEVSVGRNKRCLRVLLRSSSRRCRFGSFSWIGCVRVDVGPELSFGLDWPSALVESCLLVMGKNQLGQRIVNPAGAIALIFATISWAFGSVYSRHAPKPKSALLAVAMQMMAGGFLQFLAGFALGEAHSFSWARITPASAWAFVYLTLIGSLVGFTAYVWLLQVSTPAKVSTYAYVNPLIAVALGHVVLKEGSRSPRWRQAPWLGRACADYAPHGSAVISIFRRVILP